MPVRRHTEITTSSAAEAQDAVARLFCNHVLEPAGGRDADVGLSLRADELGPLSIVHLDYGAPVAIRPDPLMDFFLVQVPRGGAARIVQDGVEVASSVGVASVLSPTGNVAMEWGAGNPQLCVYLARDVVERELALLLGRPVDKPLVFAPGMVLHEAGNAAWLRSVLFLNDELRRGTSLTQRPELVDSFASTLAGQLLVSQPHNYTALLSVGEPMRTSTVQQAVDFIEAHVGDPGLTVSVIAREVGMSVRSLQEAFRRELGRTPISYIKDRRMSIAQRRLRAGDPAVTTVTRIAAGVGVTHLGRFSVEYRNRFGESPSETLASR